MNSVTHTDNCYFTIMNGFSHVLLSHFSQIIDAINGNYFTLRGIDKPVLNLTTFDFLGLSQNQAIKRVSEEALEKYGCGSCGPRGFYGTIDPHLKIESEVARFLGTEEAIVYSDGASAVSSAIPAFSKKGDLLIIDEACGEPVLTGANLSRSTVQFFKHNDMKDLESILTNIAQDDKRLRRDATEQRRFIVVEGLYKNTGNFCPLPEIIALKEKFFYRLILDDSLAFGAVGKTGKGVTEMFGVPVTDVEIMTVALDTALASVGGLCVGTREIVDHQRLSGAGYCFSASAPPFLAAAATQALAELEANPTLITTLAANCKEMYEGLRGIKGWRVVSSAPSPVLHLAVDGAGLSRADQHEIVLRVAEECIHNGLAVVPSRYALGNKHAQDIQIQPSLRVAVSASLTSAEVKKAVSSLSKIAKQAVGTK